MNIILFGPPGAGKGTQANHIVKKLNSFQVSTGDMLRNEIQKDTEIGKKIINDMNDGKFVSDEIVNTIIKKFIYDPKKKNKLIFDGYPRSLEQAKNLGMKTCWLENDEAFAKKDADKPYIDYKINNLPSFLQKINVLRNN